MLKWIRPSGAIGFLFLVTVVGLFWWLLADWLLKTSIETAGTKMVGAGVELANADLTFNPLGFHLAGLQVTNPKQPMQNLVQFEQVNGSLELLPLLMGQVIIKELSATGVRLDTERKISGEIKAAEPGLESEPKQEAAAEPMVNLTAVTDKLPSVDEILAKEPLVSLDQITAFAARIKTERAEFEKSSAALPSEDKLKQHEKRIQELTEGNVKSVDELRQREQDLKKLKDDIRADRDALSSVRDQLKSAKGDISQGFAALRNAPAADWDRLKSRYGFDSAGVGNITRLVFGDSAKRWLNRILAWVEQAQGMVSSDSESSPKSVAPQRGEGRNIHFTTAHPLPDFLIQKAVLSLEISAGKIELELQDATHQPNILGRPMRLHAQADNLQSAEQIKIDGIIDHVKQNTAKDTITGSLIGLKMANVSLSQNASFPLTLTTALVNISGDLEYRAQSLTANVKAMFNDAQWSSTATEGWTGHLVKSLTTIQKFNLDGQIQGSLRSPEISLRSDLDGQLKQAVAAQLKSTQDDLENQFKARLNEKIAEMAGPHKDQLAFLSNQEDVLDQRINKLSTMLKAELKSATDTKKQEAADKLKGKLKGLTF